MVLACSSSCPASTLWLSSTSGPSPSTSLPRSQKGCQLSAVYSFCLSQEILTSDSVTVRVDAVVYYNIKDPMAAILNVERYAESTKLLAATTLRNMMGTKTLMQILEQKEEMTKLMMETLDDATDAWGIRVEMIEVEGEVFQKPSDK